MGRSLKIVPKLSRYDLSASGEHLGSPTGKHTLAAEAQWIVNRLHTEVLKLRTEVTRLDGKLKRQTSRLEATKALALKLQDELE